MKRVMPWVFAAGLLAQATLAWSAPISFDFVSIGQVVATDCVIPPLPIPLCADINGPGTANDVPDVIPGTWIGTLSGQVLFGLGNGTFYYDDTSAANNDFFGTWQDVLGLPDASGIAIATFTYYVQGGSGIFAGLTGSGTSTTHVVVAPAGFDPNGAPIFASPCQGAPSGIGAFCESGHFNIAEPQTVVLLIVAALAALWSTSRHGAARRRAPRTSRRA